MKKAMVIVWVIAFLALLASCNAKNSGAAKTGALKMQGSKWLLQKVGGAPVPPLAGGERPFLQFDAAQKKATGFGGCNHFSSACELDGASVKFGPVGSTKKFCPDPEGSLEREFFRALTRARQWEIQGDELLLTAGGQVLARFARENIPGITGAAWQWVQTRYNDGKKVAPADPENYTVHFQEDGTINVKADCNRKGGTWAGGENRLSIEITLSTMAFCPEGSLENEFVRGLTGAALYFIKDGDLYIDLIYDTGTMRFSRR